MSCSYDVTVQSKFREKEKFVSRRLFTFSIKTFHQEILCLQVPVLGRATAAKKVDRKACVIMHVQSNQSFAC